MSLRSSFASSMNRSTRTQANNSLYALRMPAAWKSLLDDSMTVSPGTATVTPEEYLRLTVTHPSINQGASLLIQDGSQTLQFLDLTSTQGMTIANAVSTFSGDGFHWASGAEVAQLYGAFGITYQSVVKDVIFLSVPSVQAAAYTSYLGTTFGNASIGWVDDNTDGSFHTYSCISIDTCRSGAFVANNDLLRAAERNLGVFLVRSTAIPVAEPGTTALIGIGLAGILALRRRGGKM